MVPKLLRKLLYTEQPSVELRLCLVLHDEGLAGCSKQCYKLTNNLFVMKFTPQYFIYIAIESLRIVHGKNAVKTLIQLPIR
jgi:hypothetical protein